MPETIDSVNWVMTATVGKTYLFRVFIFSYRDSLLFAFVDLLELAQLSMVICSLMLNNLHNLAWLYAH